MMGAGWLRKRRAAAAARAAEREARMEASRNVHDYRDHVRGWGHDIGYSLLGDHRLDAHGWGHGLRPGDYVVLSNRRTGGEPWYIVEAVQYCRDPKDMWFATLAWALTRPATRQVAPPAGTREVVA